MCTTRERPTAQQVVAEMFEDVYARRREEGVYDDSCITGIPPKTEGERVIELHVARRRAKAIERARREADAAVLLRALRRWDVE